MQVVRRAWPDVQYIHGCVSHVDEGTLGEILNTVPSLTTGLVVGGPPCQGFSKLNALRKGFDDPRSKCISMFADLIVMLRAVAPHVEWHALMENVASMTGCDLDRITAELAPAYAANWQEQGYGFRQKGSYHYPKVKVGFSKFYCQVNAPCASDHALVAQIGQSCLQYSPQPRAPYVSRGHLTLPLRPNCPAWPQGRS